MRNDSRISQIITTDTRAIIVRPNAPNDDTGLTFADRAMTEAILCCRTFERAIDRAKTNAEAIFLRERLAVIIAEFQSAENLAGKASDDLAGAR